MTQHAATCTCVNCWLERKRPTAEEAIRKFRDLQKARPELFVDKTPPPAFPYGLFYLW